jgi:hypothetical protein
VTVTKLSNWGMGHKTPNKPTDDLASIGCLEVLAASDEGERSDGPDATFRTLSCQWNLARGFKPPPRLAAGALEVVGFSEAGVTTVAG